MRTLLLLILICSSVTAGEETGTPVSAFMKACNQYETKAKVDEAKAKAAYNLSLIKIKTDQVNAIQKRYDIERKVVDKDNVDELKLIKDRIKKLEEEIKELKGVEEKAEFKTGTYMSKEFPASFTLQLVNNEYRLSISDSDHHSITSKVIDNKLLFQWSNGNDIIMIEKISDIKCKITIFSGQFKNALFIPTANIYKSCEFSLE